MQLINEFNYLLNSFNIKATCVSYNNIGNYSYYDIKLHNSARVKDIQKYSDELSLALKMPCRPTIKLLHSSGVVRVEFILPRKANLELLDYMSNNNIPRGNINCLLGQAVDGNELWMDLSANPNLIISGTTGSGKSVLLHNIIANLYNYNDVDLFLVDPKNIEFIAYKNSMRNTAVMFSYHDALIMLNDIISLMESRYNQIRDGHAVSFKDTVIIIDEFADLIMQDKNDNFYKNLCLLSQKCRAAQIYIILATQRPSVNIINGSIKSNFPARIACRVASHTDSKVILDATGAEDLLGNGDALIKDNFRNLERFQIAYINSKDIYNIFKN